MSPHSSRRMAAGFSLIELMVAMVLGLIVTGATLTVFLSNRQTYAATESLGRIQENARTAFELMARDLREAAGNACGNNLTSVNVIDGASSNWYTDWGAGIQGFDAGAPVNGLVNGTAEGNRVDGTDVIDIRSSTTANISVVPDVSGGSAEIKIAANTLALAKGDIVAICDPAHMAVFQVTGYNAANVTVGHNKGNANPSPGNSDKELGTPIGSVYNFGCKEGSVIKYPDCASNPANQWPAFLAKMKASRWYVGHNGDGTQSLFRVSLVNSGGNAGTRVDEIAEGIDNMQIKYLMEGQTEYTDAASVTDWAAVRGIQISLTVNDQEKGTDGNPLTRRLKHTVAIRNRLP